MTAPSGPAADADVLFEDDDIVVVYKPAGVIVHSAPGHEEGSLAEALARRRPSMAKVGSAERPAVFFLTFATE